MQVAVDVVLDGGHVEVGQEPVKAPLLVVGHAGAERVLKTRHHDHGLHFVMSEGLAQGGEIDAGARLGWHLEGAQAEALDRFEEAEIGGSLERHGVARAGDGAQREVDGLATAHGDHEFVVRERRAGQQVAAGDLAGERIEGPRHGVATEHGGVVAAHGAEDAREFLRGEKGVVRAGGAEGHVARVGGVHEHLRGEIVDADVAGSGHRSGHAWLGRVARQAWTHVVAGLRTGLEETAAFEQRVGLQYGGDADVALQRHASHGGHAVAGAQCALLDELLQGVGETGVERSGLGRDERLDHGGSGC
jgi:hypothetical protein